MDVVDDQLSARAILIFFTYLNSLIVSYDQLSLKNMV